MGEIAKYAMEARKFFGMDLNNRSSPLDDVITYLSQATDSALNSLVLDKKSPPEIRRARLWKYSDLYTDLHILGKLAERSEFLANEPDNNLVLFYGVLATAVIDHATKAFERSPDEYISNHQELQNESDLLTQHASEFDLF